MTDTYKILGQTLTGQKAINNVDVKESTLYTVPANTNAALSSIIATNSSDTTQEYNVSVLKNGEDINTVESFYFKNAFYTINPNGKVQYSEDGTTWNTLQLNLGHTALFMASTDKHLVVVGPNKLSYSIDSKTWTQVHTGFTPNAIASSGNKVVVLTNNNKSILFNDTTTTEIVYSSTPFTGYQMIYAENKFVAIDYYNIMYSEDGLTWISNSYTGNNTYGIASFNGLTVAAGWYEMFRSTNGTKMEEISFREGVSNIRNIDGVFYAYGYNGIWRSSDAVTWEKVADPARNIEVIKKSGGMFLAYGNGWQNSIGYSSDGYNWSFINTPYSVRSAEYLMGHLVYVSGSNAGGVHSSINNGSSWNSYHTDRGFFATSNDNSMYITAYGFTGYASYDYMSGSSSYQDSSISGQYAPEGSPLQMVLQPWNGNVYVRSPQDGSWTSIYVGMTWIKDNSFRYANGVYTMTQSKTLKYSFDGYNWNTTQLNFASNNEPNSVVWTGNLFAAVSYTDYAYSYDGSTWNYSWARPQSYALAYSGNKFHALNYNQHFILDFSSGSPVTSIVNHNFSLNSTGSLGRLGSKYIVASSNFESNVYDISNDTVVRTSARNTFRRVAYGNGKYYAVDGTSYLYSSDDGITWTEKNSFFSGNVIVFGNNKFYIGTTNGTIISTSDFIDFTEYNTGNSITDGTFDGTQIIMVAPYTSYVTQDGINWSTGSIPTYTGRLYFLEGKYLASGGDNMSISTDGLLWTQMTSHYHYILASINNALLAINWTDISISYDDGQSWQTVVPYLWTAPMDCTIFNNKLYIIGYGGVYFTEDGLVWTQASSIQFPESRIAFVNNKFVISTQKTTLVTEDFNVYTERVPFTASGIIVNKNDQLVAFGSRRSGGTVLAKSINGLDWTIVGTTFGAPHVGDVLLPEAIPTSLNKQTIIYKKQINPGQVHEIQGGITLSSGDKIRVYSDSNEIIFNAYGVEIQ